jgi:CIC family chloride channel protein
MPAVAAPTATALFWYLCIGAVMGVLSTLISKAVYAIEDAFERLPIHWMWWPAIGAVAVGVIGFVAPRTLGVGYNNITDILSGDLVGGIMILFFVLKFLSWSISLGSGTSGGTLAPLLTIGGGIGAAAGALVLTLFPGSHLDPHVAALVGMAALFAGASRALLASVVFAFEATVQPFALLPLLAGCSVSYLVSSLLMKQSIMTEKIARRGVQVPSDYSANFLEQIVVGTIASRLPVTLKAGDTVSSVREWIMSQGEGSEHHVFPIVDTEQQFLGIITWKDIFTPINFPDTIRLADLPRTSPLVVYEDNTLLDAVEIMAESDQEYVAIVDRNDTLRITGIITWRDVMTSYQKNLRENRVSQKSIRFTRREHRPRHRASKHQ